jgi:hypothetical protein
LARKSLFEAKNIEKYRLSGKNLSIMMLENSSDYRDFDNNNLSITNTGCVQMQKSISPSATFQLSFLTTKYAIFYEYFSFFCHQFGGKLNYSLAPLRQKLNFLLSSDTMELKLINIFSHVQCPDHTNLNNFVPMAMDLPTVVMISTNVLKIPTFAVITEPVKISWVLIDVSVIKDTNRIQMAKVVKIWTNVEIRLIVAKDNVETLLEDSNVFVHLERSMTRTVKLVPTLMSVQLQVKKTAKDFIHLTDFLFNVFRAKFSICLPHLQCGTWLD